MSRFTGFSQKQRTVLCWWMEGSGLEHHDAIICDGAVRSGKTVCMSLSFVAWSLYRFQGCGFAICGKTIASLRRNVIAPLVENLTALGFACEEKVSKNYLEISYRGRTNRYYLFGGKDESSAALVQGITLAGVLFDEVALMPRSFVEQALARCSVEGSTFWFNCNPEHPQHWFYTQWIQKAEEKNALYLHFTMEDNPSLSPQMRRRYETLYSGSFYDRFVLGRWAAPQGLVYPMFDPARHVVQEAPPCGRYYISCDYGTVNPTSMGLWGEAQGVWYRVKEYYHSARSTGVLRTDEEHYAQLEQLAQGYEISAVIVDPSAASFQECIRRHGAFPVIPAQNQVLDGIRQVGDALLEGRLRFCAGCSDTLREFSLYRWDEKAQKDQPVKENDHAMDDIRYLVMTVMAQPHSPCLALSVERGEGAAVQPGRQIQRRF